NQLEAFAAEPCSWSLGSLGGPGVFVLPHELRRGQLEERLQGDGKAEPLADAFIGSPGIDAQQVAFLVIKAATAIPGVDRSLGLDDTYLSRSYILGPQLRDDAL